MTATILNDVFSDVLDILELQYDKELAHIECAKTPTPLKAVQDRSKCLRSIKCVLDQYLNEDISNGAVHDSKILGAHLVGEFFLMTL
ncbi:13591_t:CDS:2 [Entrophospora sp. SA101]|nr:13591_t:CDS:2 [Entrophospora sp. SA101]